MRSKIISSLVRLIGLRLQMFVEEARLEKMRLLRAIWCIAIGFAFIQIFLASLLALGIELTEGASRIWFLSILGSVSLLGAFGLIFVSVRTFSSKKGPFPATASALKEDKECLESVLKS